MTWKIERRVDRDVKEPRFYVIEVKLVWIPIRIYNFRVLNAIPMVTTKKIEHMHKGNVKGNYTKFHYKKSTKHKR